MMQCSPRHKSFWHRFNKMQSDMQRIFDVSPQGHLPVVNVWEQDDVIRLEAELPGLALADIEVFVTNGNVVTIKGDRKAPARENATQHRAESMYGAFARSFSLPWDVNEDKVEAKFEHGVLHVALPKSEQAKPRKIDIKG